MLRPYTNMLRSISLPCNSLLGRMGISYNIIIGISWDIGFLTEGYHYISLP